MKLRGWHITRGSNCVTLSRGRNARFDVSAEALFPLCDPLRLAVQVRQDLWRDLQQLRGFRPIVHVEAGLDQLTVRAGGELMGHRTISARVSENIVDLLNNPDNRRRWVNWARKGQSRVVSQ